MGSWLRRVSSPDCRLLEHKTLSNRLKVSKDTVLEGPQFQLGLNTEQIQGESRHEQ